MRNVSSHGEAIISADDVIPSALEILRIAGGSQGYNQQRALELHEPGDEEYRGTLLKQVESETGTYMIQQLMTILPDDAFVINHHDHDETLGPAAAMHTWYIKPLDGRNNFLHGYGIYTLSVARVETATNRALFGAICSPRYEQTWWFERNRAYWRRAPRREGRALPRHDIGQARTFALNFPHERDLRQAFMGQLPDLTQRFQHMRMFGSGGLHATLVAEGRMAGLLEFDVKPGAYLPAYHLIRLGDGLVETLVLRDGSTTLIAARRPQDFDYLRNAVQALL